MNASNCTRLKKQSVLGWLYAEGDVIGVVGGA